MSGPDMRRDSDLERIEAALAEGAATAADPRERELQELALALRADSPEPRPQFAHELGSRVAAGFGKPAREPRRRLQRLWVPAFAAAAGLIVVAVIALGSLGGNDRGSGGAVVSEAQPKAGAPGTDLLIAPPSTAGAPAQDFASRHVERNAQLTITAPRDELQKAADSVGTVAESHHGFVLSSHITTGESGDAGGSFVLRVPAKELQSTLADLSKLGHLRARSESDQDRTIPFRNVQDRLGSDLVERHTLRLRLRHAHGAKADSIRARIAKLNAEIDALSGRMRGLKQRTLFSTVNVTLEQDRGAAGAGGGGTGAAWHDAMHTLGALLNFFVRAMGVLL